MQEPENVKITDMSVTVAALKELVLNFIEERAWQQFHDPKNLSMNIAIEAAELMEIFNWVTNSESFAELDSKRKEVEEEVADIAFALLNFCLRANIDLSTALTKKLVINAQKYPADQSKGRKNKYTDYTNRT